MEYAEGLFDKEKMSAFHDHYIRILEALLQKQEPDWNIRQK